MAANTASVQLSHDAAVAGEPASSITLSNGINAATGNPVSSIGRKPKDQTFNVWVTATSGAAAINVVGVQVYGYPHSPYSGQNLTGCAIRFDQAPIGPGQNVAVPANGSLTLSVLGGSVFTPQGGYQVDGENLDGISTAWAQNTVYSAGNYVVNPNNGTTFICVKAGTSATTGLGPVGGVIGQIDGTVVWNPGKQQQFDVGATVYFSDGSQAVASTATLTVQNVFKG